ncbi:tetratricopeptide repeat-containing sensor histidine kinase [Mucilaginibacter paludis]|nr:tetratricopeptide repeat-containing sensor histidine kinase [Mucilaginibacter paludis]
MDLLKQYQHFKGKPENADEVSICNRLAEKFFFSSTDSALTFAQAALTGAKKLKLQTERARAMANIAKVKYIGGAFFQSLTYADSAVALSGQINYIPGLAGAINTRGLIYLGQNRFADAIPEFQQALVYNTKLKDSSRMSANYFNIGLCNDELNRRKQAFEYLQKSLHIAQQCKDNHMIQMALNRLGEVYYHLKNYPKALSFFKAALNFRNYQDNWEKTFAYSGIAEVQYVMGDYRQALENANKGFIVAKQLNAPWDTERAVKIMAQCYAALNDYEKAYHYQAMSRAYADSLTNERSEKEINYLHLRDKNAENLKLVKENEYNRQVIKSNRVITSLVAAFALLLVGVLFSLRRNIKLKNKLNLELQASNQAIAMQKAEIQAQQGELIALNQTKDRVLAIIGHDLRSPFASVLQALELMDSDELDEAEQKEVMQSFHQQLTLVAGLTNNLLNWANSQHSGATLQTETVELTDVTTEVLALYYSVYTSKQQRISHSFDVRMFVSGDQQHIRIILQNIISNAIKFTPRGGEINVFYTMKDGFTGIHIKDSGKGMPPAKLKQLFISSGRSISEKGTDQELGSGLGLFLIKQFVEENKGYIEVKSEPDGGSEFVVYFQSVPNSFGN